LSSVLFAALVGVVYVTGVVGLHRFNVWRMRRASAGFPPLRWLDWDTLFEGLLPTNPAVPFEPEPSALPDGSPAPLALNGEGEDVKRALLSSLVLGNFIDEPQLFAAGFSGGEVRWLKTLIYATRDPDRALERLESGQLGSAAELYLREYLRLTRRANVLNLELAVFGAKRRLSQGLARFGDRPALYFARALASSLIGFNRAAIDDLARAVYFSRQAPFYRQAVISTPYVEEVRPALVQQCRRGWMSSAPTNAA
jgi:hypothetical protein